MDPQTTFRLWYMATIDGDFDNAAEVAEAYNNWVGKGGFPAHDDAGDPVLRLDCEQDRYLASVDGGAERWRVPK